MSHNRQAKEKSGKQDNTLVAARFSNRKMEERRCAWFEFIFCKRSVRYSRAKATYKVFGNKN
jgi:hypothetical protein